MSGIAVESAIGCYCLLNLLKISQDQQQQKKLFLPLLFMVIIPTVFIVLTEFIRLMFGQPGIDFCHFNIIIPFFETLIQFTRILRWILRWIPELWSNLMEQLSQTIYYLFKIQ